MMENKESQIKTINKYPLAFVVCFVTVLLTTFINKLFSTNDDRSKECMEQVGYLRTRVETLEKDRDKQVSDYRNTILYKDAQIRNRDLIIDSLKYEK